MEKSGNKKNKTKRSLKDKLGFIVLGLILKSGSVRVSSAKNHTSIRENIEKANTKYPLKAVLLSIGIGAILVSGCILGVNGLAAAKSLTDTINFKDLLENTKGALIWGNAVFASLIVYSAGWNKIDQKAKGIQKLEKVAIELNERNANIDYRSLQNAFVLSNTEISDCYHKGYSSSSNVQIERTTNNLVMQSLSGKIVVAREIVDAVRCGKNLKVTSKDSKHTLLNTQEAKELVEQHPEVKQLVLATPIKRR